MSLINKVFESSILQIAISLSQRFIGILSTAIVARALSPDDFAILAILSIATHLIDVLTDTGAKSYIIKSDGLTKEDIDTAWSFELLTKSIMTTLLWFSSDYLASYLEIPQASEAIKAISLTIPIRALSNPSIILLAKELNYRVLLKVSVIQKILSFTVVILALLITKTYWAVIAGEVFSAACYTTLSYIYYAKKMKFTLSRISQQWDFSQWSLLRGLTGFTRSQIDLILVSKHYSPYLLGAYHIQRDTALIPALTILIPASEPLMAAVSKSIHTSKDYKEHITTTIFFYSSILTPFTVALYLFDKDITWALLGEKWISHSQLLAIFSLMFYAYCLNNLISDQLTALNKIKTLFLFDLASTLILLSTLLLATKFTIDEFALTRSVSGILITGALTAYTLFFVNARLTDILTILTSTLTSILISKAIIYNTLYTEPETAVQAFTNISFVAPLFIATTFFLYHLCNLTIISFLKTSPALNNQTEAMIKLADYIWQQIRSIAKLSSRTN